MAAVGEKAAQAQPQPAQPQAQSQAQQQPEPEPGPINYYRINALTTAKQQALIHDIAAH